MYPGKPLLTALYLSLQQDSYIITKNDPVITVSDNDSVLEITYTQEETLKLRKGKGYIQLRWVDNSGEAYASEIKEIDIETVLQEGVIKYE